MLQAVTPGADRLLTCSVVRTAKAPPEGVLDCGIPDCSGIVATAPTEAGRSATRRSPARPGRSARNAASVALVALLCNGCALATATPPQVEVAAVGLRGAGLLDQVLAVTLCVTNPNRSELSFRRIAVDVDAEGSPLAEGVSDTAVRLPPGSSVLVPFTVVSTVRNLGPQLLGVVRTGAVDYRLHGTVTLDTLGITVPFSRSGRLDLLTSVPGMLADAAMPTAPRCQRRAGADA